MTDESDAWAAQEPIADAAVEFAVNFLGCRMGAADDQVLNTDAIGRLKKIARAVSWVESRHGTGIGGSASIDPIQSGNPRDAWWKELTGQSGTGDRFIRGPGLSNLWSNQVTASATGFSGFASAADLGLLGDQTKGHNDAAFSPSHSYVWGLIYLIFKINTTAGDKCYQCGDVSRGRLVDGAAAYNSNIAGYRANIEKALDLIGGMPTFRTELVGGWTPRDIERQFNRLTSAGWGAWFDQAAKAYDFDTSLIMALSSRETNVKNIIGDNGHGYGLMQIDDRSEPEWCHSGIWKDVHAGILKGVQILDGKRETIRAGQGKKLKIGSLTFTGEPNLSAQELLNTTIAAYNSGLWAYYGLSVQGDPDYKTTGHDYSADVLRRQTVFANLLL